MTQQTNPNPADHDTVLDLVNNNANDAETRLQDLEAGNIPEVNSNGLDLGQTIALPALGPTPTLENYTADLNGQQILNAHVIINDGLTPLQDFEYAFIDTAALVDSDFYYRFEGVRDVVNGVVADKQTYIGKSAGNISAGAALYADSGTGTSSGVICGASDDGNSIVQISSDSGDIEMSASGNVVTTDCPMVVDTNSAKTPTVGGDVNTPFGIIPSLVKFSHLHGESGLVPNPPVTDPDIIGGCFVGTTFQVSDLSNDNRISNTVSSRDDIGGYISFMESEVDKGSTGVIRTRANMSAESPNYDADISAVTYESGTSNEAETRLSASSDLQGQVTLRLRATDLLKTVNIGGLPTFADNVSAVAGGLFTDDVYKTLTGELRIVV